MTARLADTQADYRRLGLEPGHVRPDEERTHVDGSAGSFEWWFLKADMPGGTAVIGITSAPLFMGELGLTHPSANLILNLPGRDPIVRQATLDAGAFSSFDDDSGVAVGDSFYRREATGEYHSHFDDGETTVDLRLHADAPGWRPETGHILFGENESDHLGWYIPAPGGRAEISVHSADLDQEITGTGYIDRGWMNVPLGEFLDHWNWYYWTFGAYTVAAITIAVGDRDGTVEFPFFMVHKDGELLAGGPGTQTSDHISYLVDAEHTDPASGRTIVDAFHYDYRDGARRFTLTVTNTDQTEHLVYTDALPMSDEEKAHTSIAGGFEARFTGPAVLEHFEGDVKVAEIQAEGEPFDEQMFMGSGARQSGTTA